MQPRSLRRHGLHNGKYVLEKKGGGGGGVVETEGILPHPAPRASSHLQQLMAQPKDAVDSSYSVRCGVLGKGAPQ
jgi:hypothetical protein